MQPSSPPDKRLFTPGPITTSLEVKLAMLHDPGSRDPDFLDLVKSIRARLLALANVSQSSGFETVLIQGSGTFGVEAVLSSALPPHGKLLALVNGAYGERMVAIANRHRIPVVALRWPENRLPNPAEVETALANDPGITHVAAVHCETTTGILNPIDDIGRAVARHRRSFVVDAMSSFGAIPLHPPDCAADFVVSSANKCIEGVPGFALVIARREALTSTRGQARTLSLDLYDQWAGLEADGQFRFTPPTHALLAFARALDELDAEGGVAGRGARYRANQEALRQGMTQLGFRPYLNPEHQSPIITTFHYPDRPDFRFADFYAQLSLRGFLIYPGKLTRTDCFRIGSIGRLYPSDMLALVEAVRAILGGAA